MSWPVAALSIESDAELGGAELALRDRVVASTRSMAGGLAHDLNSPLQLLGDAAYLLREQLARIEASPSQDGVEQIREVAAQLENAFERMRTISRSISQLVPGPESPEAVVRLEVELEIVGALTRSEWHRDADLTIDSDSIKLTGIPRLLLRQVLIDLVLSVVGFVIKEAQSTLNPIGVRRGIALRATSASGRVLIEVTAEGCPRVDPSRSSRSEETISAHQPCAYEPLLTRYGITTTMAPGFASVILGPDCVVTDGLFLS